MHARIQLLEAIEKLKRHPKSGVAFRTGRAKYAQTMLSAAGSRIAGSRFNPPNKAEILYAALDRIAADHEAVSYDFGSAAPLYPPTITTSITFALERVVILDDQALRLLGTNLEEMTGDWRRMQRRGLVAPTQALGRALYDAGDIQAFVVESARVEGSSNLALFPRRAKGLYSLYDPFDELPQS